MTKIHHHDRSSVVGGKSCPFAFINDRIERREVLWISASPEFINFFEKRQLSSAYSVCKKSEGQRSRF